MNNYPVGYSTMGLSNLHLNNTPNNTYRILKSLLFVVRHYFTSYGFSSVFCWPTHMLWHFKDNVTSYFSMSVNKTLFYFVKHLINFNPWHNQAIVRMLPRLGTGRSDKPEMIYKYVTTRSQTHRIIRTWFDLKCRCTLKMYDVNDKQD